MFNATAYGHPYGNITIWQDRNATRPLVFDSNSLAAQGGIYAAPAHVSFSSNVHSAMQLVAASASFDSNATLRTDVSNLSQIETYSWALLE